MIKEIVCPVCKKVIAKSYSNAKQPLIASHIRKDHPSEYHTIRAFYNLVSEKQKEVEEKTGFFPGIALKHFYL